jgi:dihydrofolate reductase
MRKLVVSEFVSLDGVIQAPGGKDEDRDGGFEHGGWTWPYWHDDIGATFGAMMQNTDAFLLGRKTYEIHARAFEPMPAGDVFGDMMNRPKKHVVSRTLDTPIWRDTTIIRADRVGRTEAVVDVGRSAEVQVGDARQGVSRCRSPRRAAGVRNHRRPRVTPISFCRRRQLAPDRTRIGCR